MIIFLKSSRWISFSLPTVLRNNCSNRSNEFLSKPMRGRELVKFDMNSIIWFVDIWLVDSISMRRYNLSSICGFNEEHVCILMQIHLQVSRCFLPLWLAKFCEISQMALCPHRTPHTSPIPIVRQNPFLFHLCLNGNKLAITIHYVCHVCIIINIKKQLSIEMCDCHIWHINHYLNQLTWVVLSDAQSIDPVSNGQDSRYRIIWTDWP